MELHTRLLTEAARRHLRPLGLTQKGRSRTWLDDRGWFVSVVEFQPSGFSQGSYLNVGAHFLWCWTGSLSFDLGYRVQGFEPFETGAEFTAVADSFAVRAAIEVRDLRERLCHPSTVADVVWLPEHGRGWPSYHRAVSLALSGHPATAAREFQLIAEENKDNIPWVLDFRRRCDSYAKLALDPDGFRAGMTDLIGQQRRALKLPAVEDPLSG